MIRILFGSALPVLGLGAATALLGPDLVTGPRGEPMIVAAPGAATLQSASFEGAACAYPLLLDERRETGKPRELPAGAHVVTLSFRHGADGTSVTIERGEGAAKADEALRLAFDDSGRIVAVSYPVALGGQMPDAAYAADCLEQQAAKRPAGI